MGLNHLNPIVVYIDKYLATTNFNNILYIDKYLSTTNFNNINLPKSPNR